MCKKKNFNSYEISNFAKNKFECVHNLNYWRCGNFIGIGPGAHGRFEYKRSRFSYKNIMNPENWLEKSLTSKNPIQKLKEISKLEQFEELIMMGLRTSEGINLNNIEKKTNISLNMDKLDYLKKSKFISLKNKNLHLLTKGKLVLNKIVNELLT